MKPQSLKDTCKRHKSKRWGKMGTSTYQRHFCSTIRKTLHCDCGDCGSPDPARNACSCRDECLQYKTKSNGYWVQTCPLFIAWLQKRARQGQRNEGSNKGRRFSAAYASPQQISPSAIAPVGLQVSDPPSLVASENRTNLPSPPSHDCQIKAKRQRFF